MACNPRRLKCPAPDTSAPHSTRRRVGTFIGAVDELLNLLTVPLMPLMETNPPRRGGPLCPPARIDTAWLNIDVYPPLAGWMHRVCADLAGWDENSVWFSVRLRWSVA